MKENFMDNLEKLKNLMASLRNSENGCPWDLEQDFASLTQYVIEEAYEVAAAVANNDNDELREELGDLLLQVVFYSQIAKEKGLFEFEDVAAAINDKLIRRHPHIFGDAKILTAQEQAKSWEEIKKAERAAKGKKSVLSSVPEGIPALMRAVKLQEKAAEFGFDWDDVFDVIAKILEELSEVQKALSEDKEKLKEEIGDLFFAVVNLSRKLDIDPKEALRLANKKFENRFSYVESNGNLSKMNSEEMDILWDKAKMALS